MNNETQNNVFNKSEKNTMTTQKFYGKCDAEFKTTNLCFFVHTIKLVSFICFILIMTFSCAASLPTADMSQTEMSIYHNDILTKTTLHDLAHSNQFAQVDREQSLDFFYSTCQETSDLFACYAVSYLQQHNHI